MSCPILSSKRGNNPVMQIQCGSQFTPKLEGMFNDIRLSETVNENFQDYLEQNPPNEPLPSLTVNVRDCILPVE